MSDNDLRTESLNAGLGVGLALVDGEGRGLVVRASLLDRTRCDGSSYQLFHFPQAERDPEAMEAAQVGNK